MADLPPRVVGTYSVPVERDADGFPLCRQCKTSIRTGKRPKQRTFCGNPECLHLWKLKSDPNYQAEHVLKRDGGIVERRYWRDETLNSIGESWGLSRERIRQLEGEAFKFLRPRLATVWIGMPQEAA